MTHDNGGNVDIMISGVGTNQQCEYAHTASFGSAKTDEGATFRSNPMVRETSKEPTTNSIGGRESFFDHSVSEPASPETGGENAEQGDKNTEAYSTLKPPDETMKFDTFEEAYEHYRQYAMRHGFGMRPEYRKTIKDNTVSRVLLVCGKYGKTKTNKEETEDV